MCVCVYIYIYIYIYVKLVQFLLNGAKHVTFILENYEKLEDKYI
jgi:hypothetical protein